MPKITVIIPLYNKEKYIARALESVLAQTYRDFELLVIDDGSLDRSAEIVRGCGDLRLRIISQANAGPGAARNRGIKESKAGLLAFLDADDEWMPEFLEKSLNALEANPDCAMTTCAHFLGREKLDLARVFKKKYGILGGAWQVDSGMSGLEIMHSCYLLNSWAILCKREAAEKYGGFRTKDCHGEDMFLWLQVAFNHRIFRLMEPLVWYHSEASELGAGRKGGPPLQAFLAEPGPIRAACKPGNREALERFLAQFALSTANARAIDNPQDVDYLLKAFPEMRIFGWEYAKLKLQMAFPQLILAARFLKKAGSFQQPRIRKD